MLLEKLSEKSSYIHILIILLLWFFLSLSFLGSSPLIDPDEGRNAEISYEMVKTNNWVFPKFNGTPQPYKPAFFFWADGISMKIFGKNEFAARLPSAIFSVLTLLILYFFLKKYTSKDIAFYSSVILATSAEFIGYSRYVIFDMTFTFFFTAVFLLFYSYYKDRKIWQILLAYIFMGLGILTKGPVILVLTWAVFAFFVWIKEKSFWKPFKLLHPELGIPIVLAICVPWFYLANKQYPGFAMYFLLDENVLRFLTNKYHRPGPIVYFIPVLFLGFFPWSYAIYGMLKVAYKKIKNKKMDDLFLYCFLWFSTIFVFFSISHSKLPHYILPAFPAVAVLIYYYFKEAEHFKYDFITVPIFTFIFMAFAAIYFFHKIGVRNPIFYAILISIFLFSLLYVFIRKQSFGNLVVLNSAISLFLILCTVYAASNYFGYYKSSKFVADFLNTHYPHKVVYAYQVPTYSLVFYYNGKVLDIGKPGTITVTEPKHIAKLLGKFSVVYDKGRRAVLIKKSGD